MPFPSSSALTFIRLQSPEGERLRDLPQHPRAQSQWARQQTGLFTGMDTLQECTYNLVATEQLKWGRTKKLDSFLFQRCLFVDWLVLFTLFRFFFLRQGLSYPKLTTNPLYIQGWPWSLDPLQLWDYRNSPPCLVYEGLENHIFPCKQPHWPVSTILTEQHSSGP